MQEVFSTYFRENIKLVAAGRTDSGVHAKQMYAHFDLEGSLQDLSEAAYRLNAFLPSDIAISRIIAVPPEAHARFDAIERTYEYLVCRRKNPFLQDQSYYLSQHLDLTLINKAASYLLGKQDFKCFSRSHTDVKTYICDVRSATWEEEGELHRFTITADRFLRNMVRAVVGTLLEAGTGKISPNDVKTIIKSRDRSHAGVSVPAKGLYLSRIRYPEGILSQHG